MEWVEHNVTKKLINIASTVKPTTHESMHNNVVQDHLKYYVEMHVQFLQSLTLNLSF